MQILNESNKSLFFSSYVIRRSLKRIPEIDRAGIEFLYLRDKMPKSDFESPKWHIESELNDAYVSAVYSPKTESKQPYIIIFLEAVDFIIPKICWLTQLSDLYITRLLAHEVAHHLISTRGFLFEPREKYTSDMYEEEMADRYAFEIVSKMEKKFYYQLGKKLMKLVSGVYSLYGNEGLEKFKL